MCACMELCANCLPPLRKFIDVDKNKQQTRNNGKCTCAYVIDDKFNQSVRNCKQIVTGWTSKHEYISNL